MTIPNTPKTATRRRHNRYGCLASARLTIDSDLYDITLVNFCETGFLVRCSDDTYNLISNKISQDSQPKAGLFSRIHDINYQCDVLIKRTESRGYLGIYVPEGISSLMFDTLMEGTEAIQTPSKAHDNSETRLVLLAHEANYLYKQVMSKPLHQYFKQLPEALMTAAEKSKTHNSVQEFFNLSQKISLRQREAALHYLELIDKQILHDFTVDKEETRDLIAHNSSEHGELELIDEESFNSWLTIKAATQRLENAVSQQLQPVLNRLKSGTFHVEDLAILPRGQIIILEQTLKKYEFDSHSIRIATHSFSSITSQHNRELLEQLDKLLERHGLVISHTLKNEANKNTSLTSSDQSRTSDPTTQQVTEGLGRDYLEPMPAVVQSQASKTPQPQFEQAKSANDSLIAAEKSIARINAILMGHLETQKGGDRSSQDHHENATLAKTDEPTSDQDTQRIQNRTSTSKTNSSDPSTAQHPESMDRIPDISELPKKVETLANTLAQINTPVLQEIIVVQRLQKLFHQQHAIGIEQMETLDLVNALQQYAKSEGARLSTSEQDSLEVIDAYFDSLYRNQFLVKSLRQLMECFRPLFAVDYITLGADFFQKSAVKSLIFKLQSIAYEPMSWMGQHKLSLMNAFVLFGEDSQGKGDYLTALDEMDKSASRILKHLNTVQNKNRNRLIHARQTQFQTQQHQTKAVLFIQSFFSRDKLIPKWFEQLMRMGWGEHLAFVAVKDPDGEEFQDLARITKLIFEVLSQVQRHEMQLMQSLIDESIRVLDQMSQILENQNVSQEMLEQWRELVIDLLNGHKNDYADMVRPGLWFKPHENEASKHSYYVKHKLSLLNPGQWLYCPHLDQGRTYIQLAWIAPDQSQFLLLNQSFIRVGDMTQEQLLDLLALPTTRIINENMLPFKPKGIESQFFRVYDKVRNGLLRDQVTGYSLLADCENALEHYLSENKPFCLVTFRTDQAEKIKMIHGIQGYNLVLAQIAIQMDQTIPLIYSQIVNCKIVQLTRHEDNFMFILSLPEGHADHRDISIVVNLVRILNQNIGTARIANTHIELALKFGCYIHNKLQYHPPYEIIHSALEAGTNSHANNHEHLPSNLHLCDASTIKASEGFSDMIAWIHSVPKESIHTRISLKKRRFVSAMHTNHYIDWLIPQAREELDQQHHLMTQFSQSIRGHLLDEWVIDQAIQKLKKSDRREIMVTLHSDIFRTDTFFEYLYEKMAQLNRHQKLHFCLSSTHTPDQALLADFVEEIRQYGSKTLLFDWGQDTQSFERIQAQSFNFVALSETLIQSQEPEKKALLSILIQLANDLAMDCILVHDSSLNPARRDSLIEKLRPAYIELHPTRSK